MNQICLILWSIHEDNHMFTKFLLTHNNFNNTWHKRESKIFLRHILLAKWINIIFSKKLSFFGKVLNALSEKITFLWNFYHVFSVLFYEWNTSINDSFRFFGVFFLETALFNGAGEGDMFFSWDGGFNKVYDRVAPPCPSPNHLYGKPWHVSK